MQCTRRCAAATLSGGADPRRLDLPKARADPLPALPRRAASSEPALHSRGQSRVPGRGTSRSGSGGRATTTEAKCRAGLKRRPPPLQSVDGRRGVVSLRGGAGRGAFRCEVEACPRTTPPLSPMTPKQCSRRRSNTRRSSRHRPSSNCCRRHAATALPGPGAVGWGGACTETLTILAMLLDELELALGLGSVSSARCARPFALPSPSPLTSLAPRRWEPLHLLLAAHSQ